MTLQAAVREHLMSRLAQTMNGRRSLLIARLTPWRVVYWLSDQRYWCWADLVAWKLGRQDYVRRAERCRETCAISGRTAFVCYCGYWEAHPSALIGKRRRSRPVPSASARREREE